MSLEQGLNIIDEALRLAYFDLERRGMPKDEAQIAMLIRPEFGLSGNLKGNGNV